MCEQQRRSLYSESKQPRRVVLLFANIASRTRVHYTVMKQDDRDRSKLSRGIVSVEEMYTFPTKDSRTHLNIAPDTCQSGKINFSLSIR